MGKHKNSRMILEDIPEEIIYQYNMKKSQSMVGSTCKL